MVWQPARKDPLIEATVAAQKADVIVAWSASSEGEEMKVAVPDSAAASHQPQSSR
jgi:hypothetical protein